MILCAFLFFVRLGDRPLHSSHEARAAQNGQSILLNDDWLLPQLFDRQVELQKPPMYYWLVACFGWLHGGQVDAWAVRLPAALCALGCAMVVYELGRWRGRPLAGFLAACLLATSVHFTWLAQVGRIDMPLTFTTTLALTGFFLGNARRKENDGRGAWPWFLLSYLALGLGLLLKGPIAVVLPAVVLAACGLAVLLSRNVNNRFTNFGLWWGVPLVLAIALPWYWLANVATRGDQFRVFFLYHNLARGFGGEENLAEHPWWFYGFRLAVDMLPWSPLLLVAGWWFWRRRLWRHDALASFGLLWLLGMIILLSFMRFKRADYLLPAFPGAALFLGCMLENFWKWICAPSEHGLPGRRPALFCCAVFFLIIAASAAGWSFFPAGIIRSEELHHPGQEFAQQVRAHTKGLVLLFRVEAHEVAFHLGPPVNTILEWENLDRWLEMSPSAHVIMSQEDESECAKHLHKGKLRAIVASPDISSGKTHRSIVLLQAVP